MKKQRIIGSILLFVTLLSSVSFAYIPADTLYNVQQKMPFTKINIEDGNKNGESYTISDMSYQSNGERNYWLNDWPLYYKNFIGDIGLVKFTFYDNEGNFKGDVMILPKFMAQYVDGNDFGPSQSLTSYWQSYMIIGKDSIIFNNNSTKEHNDEYVEFHIKFNINVKSSNNIPFFGDKDWLFLDTKDSKIDTTNDYNNGVASDENKDEVMVLPLTDRDKQDWKTNHIKIPYNKWKEVKNFNEWLNEENLKKLDEEIGFGLKDKNENKIGVIEWLKQEYTSGTCNSIKVEPMVIYPNSTEEIYCSDAKIAGRGALTFGKLTNRETEHLNQYIDGLKKSNKTYGALNEDAFRKDFFSKVHFCHIGISQYSASSNKDSETDKDATDLAYLNYNNSNVLDIAKGYYNIQYVPLTYSDTEIHTVNWQKDINNMYNESYIKKQLPIYDKISSINFNSYKYYLPSYLDKDFNDYTEDDWKELYYSVYDVEYTPTEEDWKRVFSIFDSEEDYTDKINKININTAKLSDDDIILLKELGIMDKSSGMINSYKKHEEIWNEKSRAEKIAICDEYIQIIANKRDLTEKGDNINSARNFGFETIDYNEAIDYFGKTNSVRKLTDEIEENYLDYIKTLDDYYIDYGGTEIEFDGIDNDFLNHVSLTYGLLWNPRTLKFENKSYVSAGNIEAYKNELEKVGRICKIETDCKGLSCIIVKGTKDIEIKTEDKLAEKNFLKQKYTVDLVGHNSMLGGAGQVVNMIDKIKGVLYNCGAALILPTNIATKSEAT